MTYSRSRLCWLCRRGTRELDLLLRAYLDLAYDDAPTAEQDSFTALLERTDEELQALFFGPARVTDPSLKPLVDRILEVTAPDA